MAENELQILRETVENKEIHANYQLFLGSYQKLKNEEILDFKEAEQPILDCLEKANVILEKIGQEYVCF